MQMLASVDITNGYSTAQAAELLGVDVHEVTRLYRTGAIAGCKITGGSLLLDASSVQAYKNTPRVAGRPWDPQTAWAALLFLSDANVDWLAYHRLRRLKLKLQRVSAEELLWLARKRMTAGRYSVSTSFADDLKQSLCLTGMSAGIISDFGLVASTTIIDGYSSDEQRIAEEYHLQADATGNCILRTAVDVPAGLFDLTEAPAIVVAADLATSLDVRERRSGLAYLEGALNAVRRA